ncbi:MAG: hypothetical protein B7Y90_10130 [Alphaproteobacteria bacterium 32-64-14]|nr:MAG: hypothetical protein B7Y90_10130 [Alphaproteobacteria bacterium 32-64-14]
MTKKIIAAIAATVLIAAISPSALSQTRDGLARGAVKMFEGCLSGPGQGQKPIECSCATGYFAGHFPEDAFRIFAAISSFVDERGNITDMDGAIAAADAEQLAMRMSDARFEEAFNSLGNLADIGARSERVCLAVAKEAGERR